MQRIFQSQRGRDGRKLAVVGWGLKRIQGTGPGTQGEKLALKYKMIVNGRRPLGDPHVDIDWGCSSSLFIHGGSRRPMAFFRSGRGVGPPFQERDPARRPGLRAPSFLKKPGNLPGAMGIHGVGRGSASGKADWLPAGPRGRTGSLGNGMGRALAV